MSRTNPYKKKRRSASRTLLMYSEGLSEELFLKYLRGIYSRDSGVAVTIRNGKGGNAVDIVNNAVKEPGDFDNKIVIIDNDKDQQEMQKARDEAKKQGIELLENSPCLEALLLLILRAGASFSNRTSAWCKKEFESNYLNKQKRVDINEYGKIFPKELLNQRRTDIKELYRLILLMEGKS